MPRPKKTATAEVVQEEKKSDGLIALEHFAKKGKFFFEFVCGGGFARARRACQKYYSTSAFAGTLCGFVYLSFIVVIGKSH